MELCITDYLGDTPKWQFPLNKNSLDNLHKKNPKTDKNDFENLFQFSVHYMKEAGVKFFSPGASHGRRFVYWFNSHFWVEDFQAPKFAKEELIFKEIHSIVVNNIHLINWPTLTNIKNEKLILKDSYMLNQLGRDLIQLAAKSEHIQVEFC